jgi:hypothetical protein
MIWPLTGSTPFGLINIIVTHIIDTDLADRFYNYDHKRESESHVSNVSVQEALYLSYIYILSLYIIYVILLSIYLSVLLPLFPTLSSPPLSLHLSITAIAP